VLTALATLEAKRGEFGAAARWAQRLVDLRPEDKEARALLGQINARAAIIRQQR
jgi:Flp pilus assembly protein TadD